MTLPAATSRSFWLNGSAWEYPDFENADTFVARLVRKGIIVRDAGVEAALARQPGRLPIRSTQRHFLRATGISHRTVRQIERARYATTLLKQGRLDPRHGLRSRLLRSGASHPLGEDADRPDARGDRARQEAAVVSIQNNAAAGESTMRMGGLPMIASERITVPVEELHTGARGRRQCRPCLHWTRRALSRLRHRAQGLEARAGRRGNDRTGLSGR